MNSGVTPLTDASNVKMTSLFFLSTAAKQKPSYTVRSQTIICLRKVDLWSGPASKCICCFTSCMHLIAEVIRLHERCMQLV